MRETKDPVDNIPQDFKRHVEFHHESTTGIVSPVCDISNTITREKSCLCNQHSPRSRSRSRWTWRPRPEDQDQDQDAPKNQDKTKRTRA